MSESKVDDKREPLLKKQEETKKEEEHIQVKKSKTAKSNNNKKDNKKEWSPTMKRTLKLTIGLLGSYYLAATCKCKHPTDWIYKVFVCRENEASTWMRVDSNGRPLCTEHCSPMTIDLIAGMLLTNIFLIVFWYVGEYLIDAFDKELRSSNHN